MNFVIVYEWSPAIYSMHLTSFFSCTLLILLCILNTASQINTGIVHMSHCGVAAALSVHDPQCTAKTAVLIVRPAVTIFPVSILSVGGEGGGDGYSAPM
jgi:hypothetical protein